ncbi:MAG: DUF2147 domain-containing protein [Pseudomonadota bacterium]
MKFVAASGLAAFLVAVAAQAEPVAGSKDVFGTWATEDGSARIEITDCGDGSPCGRVVWIDQASMRERLTPETAVDENNPDPARQGDPVLGLLMLSDFEEKRNDWRGGTIYDPETGRTYGSRLKRRDDGTLQVKGCVGPICQTQTWTAAETGTG